MVTEDQYAHIAPFYDLEFDSFDADVELYLGYAGMVGEPILELGCGSGRLLVPLAKAGHRVIGIDTSASMIDLARSRLEAEQVSARAAVAHGDMRDLSGIGEHRFRLIFAAINSFLHLEDREQQIAALSSIRRVLDRDGLLVLDVFHPSPDTLTRMDDRYAFDAEWLNRAGEQVQRFSHRHLDLSTQTIHTTLFYDVIAGDGVVRRQSTSYRTRYVHRFEMESLLAETGFELEGTYGSYTLDPLDRDSEQMIFVAHRTANPDETD